MELTQAMTVSSRYADLDEPYQPIGMLDYITIDSETMAVIRGEGTTHLQVARGRAGTTKATHSIGAEVTRLGASIVEHEEDDDAHPQYLEAL